MRQQIRSVDLTNEVDKIVKKIERTEKRFHKLREECADNIFRKLETKMANLQISENKSKHEQKLFQAINNINDSLERNIVLIIEKQIVLNKYIVLKSRTRDHILSKIITEQQSVLEVLRKIETELAKELKNIEEDKKILENQL